MNDRYDDFPAELRDTADRVAAALRVEVPAETARRHEALLGTRLRTRGNAGQARTDGRGAGTLVQMPGTAERSSGRPSSRRPYRRVAVLALAAAMVFGTGAIAVADEAVPGDALYGLDRALERLELVRASSPQAKADVHLAHASERLGEAAVAQAMGDPETVTTLAVDAATSDDKAIESVSGSDDTGSVKSVEERVEEHLARLASLRDRLEAEGHASTNALAALDRVIAKQTAKADARAEKRAQKAQDNARPTDAPPTEAPTDRGRPQDKGTPPGQDPESDTGRPDDAGPPADGARGSSGSSGGDASSGGGTSNRPVEPNSGGNSSGAGKPANAGVPRG